MSGQAIKKAGLKNSDVVSSAINKTSLDARHNDDIKLVSSVCLSLSSEKLEKKISEKKGLKYYEEKEPVIVKGKLRQDGRIVVIGFGPAGMMASLILSENGYRPIVLERGASVDERVEAVENFFKNAVLDTSSNVQFGEGGAGTFSDGKLTTGTKNPLIPIWLLLIIYMGISISWAINPIESPYTYICMYI